MNLDKECYSFLSMYIDVRFQQNFEFIYFTKICCINIGSETFNLCQIINLKNLDMV